MFRLTVAASVAVLLLITLRAPATKQYYAAPAAVPRQGPLFLEPVPQRPVPLARAGPGPQMMVEDVSGVVTSMPTIAMQTQLLALSQADENLMDFFIIFPFIVVGAILGYAALETAKDTFEVELPEGAEGPAYAAACIGGSVFLVAITKAGILGSIAGAFAKLLLDGWNLFAGVVLKGAILKY